jgi:hypothetical protein
MKTGLLVAVLGLAMTSTAEAERLHVSVYDKANLPPQLLKSVAENLGFIFDHSGIEVEWVEGSLSADEATLVTYTNIVSVTQERRLACVARRDIAAAIIPVAPVNVSRATLGVSRPFAKVGLNVEVYADHIAAAARDRDADEPEVLAHAMAHEIGHVLLRSSAHTASGLMAGVWTTREYGWISTGSMFFTPDEARIIRDSIAGRACGVDVAARSPNVP